MSIRKILSSCLAMLSIATVANASAVTLSGPTSSATGNYSISWSNGNVSNTLYENGSVVSQYVEASRTVSFNNRPNGSYSYFMRACGFGGCRDSNTLVVNVARPTSPPNSPSAVFFDDLAIVGDGTFKIKWNAPSSGQAVTNYRWRLGSGSWTNTGLTRETVQQTLNDGNYTYRVEACNSAGCSGRNLNINISRINNNPTVSTSESTSNDGRYAISWTGGIVDGQTPTHVWVIENGSRRLVFGKPTAFGGFTNLTPLNVIRTSIGTNRYSVQACINVIYTGQGQIATPTSDCNFSSEVSVRVTDIRFTTSPVTHSLPVRHHTSVPSFSNARADQAMANATETLQTSSASTDFACNVRMRRTGNVTQFSNGDGSIDSRSELNALNGGVNIVNDINYCGGLNPNFIGCANSPGDKIAVVPVSASVEGNLWAHEFGHNKGLPHREASGAVMRSAVSSTSVQLNSFECAIYRR